MSADEARTLARRVLDMAEFYSARPSVDEQKRCPAMAEISRRECLELAVLLREVSAFIAAAPDTAGE